MRNPERIARIIVKLHNVWAVNPDLRLGQLIVNLSRMKQGDIYWIEDDEWEQRLDAATADWLAGYQ